MAGFLTRHPAIATECYEVVKKLQVDLKGACSRADDEIDFDLLLPWLLPGWDGRERFALCLRASREYIGFLHCGDARAGRVMEWLESKAPALWLPTRSVYESNTIDCRSLGNRELWHAYLRATERVRYRIDMAVLEGCNGAPILSFVPAIRALSAFLLFDDDFVDLEQDRGRGKQSLLESWLQAGHSLRDTCSVIVSACRAELKESLNDCDLLEEFAGELFDIYVD